MREARKRRRWLWWLLLLPFLPFVPVISSDTASYDRVGIVDDPAWPIEPDPQTGDQFGPFISRPYDPKGFVVENGKVYLLSQRTWHALVLVTWVKFYEWTPEDIRELREKYTELADDSLWK